MDRKVLIVDDEKAVNQALLNSGAPIGMPSALASSLREIIQPSLLDKITMGFPTNCGWKTRSHEA